MKPLTTSVYTFSNLVEGGFLYVDKTAGILDLLRPAFAQYFLSRPRRFGKSLLISTLKAIFQGRRELFAGLHIAGTDYDWKSYPVIHLDLGTAAALTAIELEDILTGRLDSCAHEHGLKITGKYVAGRFQQLIERLAARDGKVIILVDEYDKPLLGHLGSPAVKDVQRVLKQFYGVIKATEPQQRFALLTGVSKFSKVSVFSDLNNLTDLTMSRQAATLLGYTQAELEANFPDYIDALATELGTSREEALAELREWYNGYRFHHEAETVYNPVSVMKCLDNREFRNYWFETGTPTFLVELLRRQPVDLGNLVVPESAFSTYEPTALEPLPLLVQTGYLTIQDATVTGRRRQYRLGFPNFEIAESFSMWLAQAFSQAPAEELNGALNRIVAALGQADVDTMLEALKTFFHKVPNTISIAHEKYYQTIFFTVFQLIGAMIEAEVSTSIGRIDAVVKTARDIFLFEFKLHGSAEDALRQIRDRQYAAPYRDDTRRLTLVGVAFDPETRNLGRWLVEPA